MSEKTYLFIPLRSMKMVVFLVFLISVVLNSFAEDPNVPQQVLDLQQAAKKCIKEKAYGQACLKYQEIIQAFPATEYAMNAQADIASSYMKAKDDSAATAALDELYTKYKDQPFVVREANRAILTYRSQKKFDKAISAYTAGLQKLSTHSKKIYLKQNIIVCQIVKNDFTSADSGIARLWQNDSNDPEILNVIRIIGLKYRDAGEFTRTLNLYQNALKRKPEHKDSIRIQRTLCYTYLVMGDLPKAQAEVDILIAAYSSNQRFVEVAWTLARDFRNKKYPAISLKLCDYVLSNFPEDERALLVDCDRARSLFWMGNIDTAAQYANTLLGKYKTNPKGVAEIHKLGLVFRQKKAYNHAIRLYENLLQEFPDHDLAAWIQHGKIVCYLLMNDVTKAKTEVETLFAKYKHSTDFIKHAYELGWAFRNKKEYDVERSIYDRLLQQFPQHERAVRILRSKAAMYLVMGDLTQSQACLDELFASYSGHPDFVFYLHDLGKEFRRLKQYDVERSIYDRLLQKFPQHERAVWVLRSKAAAYLEQDKSEQASVCADQLFSIYSNHLNFVKHLQELAWKFNGKKKYAKALEIYNRLLTRFPNHERAAWIQRGKITNCLMMGQEAQADKEVNALFANYKNDSGFVRHVQELAETFKKKKKPAKALDLYNRLLSQFPEDDQGARARIQCLKIETHLAMSQGAEAEAGVAVLFTNYKTCPEFVKHVHELSWAFGKKKKYTRAISLCENLLAAFPKRARCARIQCTRIKYDLAKGDTERARTEVDKLFADYKTYSGFAEWTRELAVSFHKRNQHLQALDIYRRLLNAFPTHKHAIQMQTSIVKAYLLLDDLTQADAEIDILFAKYTESTDALMKAVANIQQSYLKKNDYGKVLALSNRVLGACPEHKRSFEHHKRKLVCYLNMNARSQADATFNAIVDKYQDHPGFIKRVNGIANLYRNQKQYEKSIELYQMILALNPKDWQKMEACAGIGKATVHIDQMAMDPNSPILDSSDVDAIIQLLMTDCKDQQKLALHVFQIGEEYYFCGENAINEGDNEQAHKYYQRAISIWQKNRNEISDSLHKAHAEYYTALSYQRLGDYEEAIHSFRQTIDKWPGYKQRWHALSMIAECYDILKNKNIVPISKANRKIKNAYIEILKKYPNVPAVETAKSWLERHK